MADVLYTYNIASLELGDIILSANSQKTSRIIRGVTGSDFSHAMLYTNKVIVHADHGGVFAANPQRFLFTDGQSVVLRLHRPHKYDLAAVCKFAATKIGALYSVPQAVLATIMKKTGYAALSPAQFCSRLVAQAYESAGVRLASNPDFCVPGQFLHCPLLIEVKDAVRLALPDDIRINDSPDTLKIHQKHTFEWLEQARELAKQSVGVELSTISEAMEFVQRYPEHDVEIAGFIDKSGYLDDFKLDGVVNPHRYNLRLFREFLENRSLKVCEILEQELEINENIMVTATRQFSQETIIPSQVHQRLADTHKKRIMQVKLRLEILNQLCIEMGKGLFEKRAAQLLKNLNATLYPQAVTPS